MPLPFVPWYFGDKRPHLRGLLQVGEVWQRLGVPADGEILKTPWLIGSDLPLPASTRLDMILLLLWRIWLSRNRLIFYGVKESTSQLKAGLIHDCDFWKCRFMTREVHVSAWRDFFASSL